MQVEATRFSTLFPQQNTFWGSRQVTNLARGESKWREVIFIVAIVSAIAFLFFASIWIDWKFLSPPPQLVIY